MKFRCVVGLLLLLVLGFLAGCSSNSTSTTPPPSGSGVIFVATQGDSKLSIFHVDLSTGKLSATGTPVDTGTTPSAMILNPAGDTLFVSNSQSNDVSSYTVGSNGSLTAASGTQPAGTNPRGMAIDAGGKFLFVANQGSDDISVFSIASGGLTAVPQPVFTALSDPVALAVTPDGKYLYVANNSSNTVAAFQVDSSGALSDVPGSPFTLGTATTPAIAPSAVAVSPNGNFLYVANAQTGNISAFTICDNASPNCPVPDGTLTQVAGTPFSAGLGPTSIAISPSGTFMYVADKQSNQVSGYKISGGSGVLTPMSPSAASTGQNPVWVVVSPGEQYVYVANLGGATISAFTLDATSGVLNSVESPVATGAQPSALVMK